MLPFRMEEIFDLLNIDYQRYARGRKTFNLPCPECDHASSIHPHLNVNLDKEKWRCPKCGRGGNAVNFYHFLLTGEHSLNKSEYKEKIKEIEEVIGRCDHPLHKKVAKTWSPANFSPIAKSNVLNKTYSALLNLFELRQEEMQNLLDRGLSEVSIVKNGYKTFPAPISMKDFIDPSIKKWFNEKNISDEKKRVDLVCSDLELQIGMTIAKKLLAMGCVLAGVPGFFKFAGVWCFKYVNFGIAIPTRDLRGRIVGIQVRTKNKKFRYMTVSSKGLEMGVNENISKVHWPIQNQRPLTTETKIILTEGPLKADVAIDLMHHMGVDDVAFVAIQGVNVTKALYNDLSFLSRERNIHRIYNALDMDMLLNKNVRNGSIAIREKLKTMKISVRYLFWDETEAERQYRRLLDVAHEHQIELPKTREGECIFTVIAAYARFLEEAEIQHSKQKEYWISDTKGIDDYLNMLKSKNG